MTTSQRIKARQYDPIQPVKVLDRDRAIFASESRERVQYMTLRAGRNFRCGCPARGLCEHVIWMVLEHGHEQFRHVSVWTSEADAKRQHRRTVRFTANGRPFWVTFAGKVDPVEALDAEVEALGEEWQALRRAACPEGANPGQWFADRRVRLEELRKKLMDRQVARERAVAEKKVA